MTSTPPNAPKPAAPAATAKAAPKPVAPAPVKEKKQRILVIRLGALGDIVLCFQAFHEIRMAHPDAEIGLLTMPGYAEFAGQMPWFNTVITDKRAPAWQIFDWLSLFAKVRAFKPSRIYDLQCKLRQNILYAGLGGPWGPEWSGAAPFCSLPRLEEPMSGMHFTDYVAAQLQLADVQPQDPANVSWLDAPVDGLKLPERYAVLVPGSAPHRPYKRWPARNYAKLAEKLQEKGITCVAVGTKQDREAVTSVRSFYSGIVDLSGRTTLLQLAGVMRRATCVITNDTGPMHIAAVVGAKVLGLMSEQVNAKWSAPKGPNAKALQGKPLAELGIDKVFLALGDFLDQKG